MTGFYTDRQTRTVGASSPVGISRSEAEGNETEPSFERLMSDLTLSSGNLSRISTLSPEQSLRLKVVIMQLAHRHWELTPNEERYDLGSSLRDTHRGSSDGSSNSEAE